MGILLACVALGAAVRAGDSPADAKAAYDAGRFSEAAQIYESAVALSGGTPALHFNLGNARYREGDLGRAVLEYRRAWRLAPRDADIAANLRVALDLGGAPFPAVPWYLWPLERISPSEARALAVAGWWLGLLLLAVSWLWRRGPVGMLRRAAAVCALAGCAGLAGLRHWHALLHERVVTASDVSALYAPLEGASSHFTVPRGAIVEALEEQGPWLKVRLAGREGWIPSTASAPVVPPPASP
jgi:tetratricopeptide (TPR) repeat protein